MEKKSAIGIGIAVICVIAFVGGYYFLTPTTVTIKGSTTVSPIITKAAEAFMDQYEGDKRIDIQVSGGGSSTGVTAVGEGTVNIGMSSRDVKSSELELYPNMVVTTIAADGIALIVNLDVTIESITLEQIKAIYNGSISNWNQIGGPDKEIVVVGRDSASGTREFFYEHVMLKTNFTTDMQEVNSNGAVRTTVVETPGAIGYVGLGYVDTTTRALKVKANDTATAVEPNVANVQSGAYSVSRNLYLLTIGEPTGIVKEFIDFVLSDAGQAIVAEEKFVPIN